MASSGLLQTCWILNLPIHNKLGSHTFYLIWPVCVLIIIRLHSTNDCNQHRFSRLISTKLDLTFKTARARSTLDMLIQPSTMETWYTPLLSQISLFGYSSHLVTPLATQYSTFTHTTSWSTLEPPPIFSLNPCVTVYMLRFQELMRLRMGFGISHAMPRCLTFISGLGATKCASIQPHLFGRIWGTTSAWEAGSVGRITELLFLGYRLLMHCL